MQDSTCHENGTAPNLRSRLELPRRGPSSSPAGIARPYRAPLLALGAIAVFAILLGTMAPTPFAGAAQPASSSAIASSAFGTCNPVTTKTPSALLQGLAVPAKNVTANGTLSADMEVMAENWTTADSNITVIFPSVFFDFPRASGGNEQLFLSNRSILMDFSGWSNASFGATRNYSFPTGLQFKANAKATIDSMKLAVQATADYGQITIEVRWQWTYTPTTPGKLVHGPWSVPTNQSNWPSSVPSIFWPAPYTTFLASSGTRAVIGTNYTATLGGDVAGRTFFLEMETPGGSVVQDFSQTAPANATTFLVRIPMISYNGNLSAGAYLVHIHDACGAMMYNKTIDAYYAPSASIRFLLTPSACATKTITFNGTAFHNNTVGTFVPGPTPYSFSIPVCSGHSFHNWVTTGALHIESGSQMVVSYNGTFTVEYN
jgi:hypothetical protein